MAQKVRHRLRLKDVVGAENIKMKNILSEQYTIRC